MDKQATTNNNTRIAKNTVALYFRTLVTLFVGLYTSRVVLNVLGIENYGIYNVVGGVVAMFNIVTASLSQAISRYLTFELGRENTAKLRSIFSTSVNIQLFMAVIVVLLMEILGLWFLNYKMNISPERMEAANWVFHFSILIFVVNLLSVPYNAAIIAHEKMKAFAYVSILEAILKLVVVAGLLLSSIDKLVTYAILQLGVALLICSVYINYCRRNFIECKYAFEVDKSLLKDMTKFAGWNSVAAVAFIFNSQGINIISNIIFGVVINAARGVAVQVESIIKGFVLNFTTAVRPQIIKSYSAGNKEYLYKLICSSTKYSYFLMFVFAMPFLFEAEIILKIWLDSYPDYAPTFIRLTMISTLVSLLGEMLYTNVLAIGKLKKYMISETLVTIFVFPISYLLFYLGFSPSVSYILFSIAYFILVFIRLFYLKQAEGFPIIMYLKRTLYPIGIVTLVALIIPMLFKYFIFSSLSFIYFIAMVIICEVNLFLSIYFIGIDKQEKQFIRGKFCGIIDKISRSFCRENRF